MKLNILGLNVEFKYIVVLILILLLLNLCFSCSNKVKEHFNSLHDIGSNLSEMMGKNIRGSVYDLQFTDVNKSSTLNNDLEKFVPPYEEETKNNKNDHHNDNDDENINIYKDLETNVEKNKILNNSILFFNNTNFNPECCPSNYSNSSGCACMTPEQLNFLGRRAGNRTVDI